MEQENEDVQEEVLEQEEVETSEETVEEEKSDDTVTLTKSEYKKLNRQALAYKANKSEKTESKTQPSEKTEKDFISTVFMVKDLNADEFETLKDEAEDLGVPLEKYMSSESGKTVLSKLRAEKKSKDSNQSLTSKSPIYKKYTGEDLKGMTSAELAKILPH